MGIRLAAGLLYPFTDGMIEGVAMCVRSTSVFGNALRLSCPQLRESRCSTGALRPTPKQVSSWVASARLPMRRRHQFVQDAAAGFRVSNADTKRKTVSGHCCDHATPEVETILNLTR